MERGKEMERGNQLPQQMMQPCPTSLVITWEDIAFSKLHWSSHGRFLTWTSLPDHPGPSLHWQSWEVCASCQQNHLAMEQHQKVESSEQNQQVDLWMKLLGCLLQALQLGLSSLLSSSLPVLHISFLLPLLPHCFSPSWRLQCSP